MMKVLVMTESWRSALACIQSIGRAGHEVLVMGQRSLSPNARSKFVRRILPPLPDGSLRAVASALRAVAQAQGIDRVIPISDTDAAVAAYAREDSGNDERYVVPGMAAIRLARSRNRTTTLCRGLGITTPETLFTRHDRALDDARALGYPCFLKLSGTLASRGVFRVEGDTELQSVLARIPPDAEMQLQAPITGELVDVTAFCNEGRVLSAFTFRTDYDLSHGGTPPYALRLTEPDALQVLERIASATGWSGAIDLDLLRMPDGRLALLEINPRFSGTTVFPYRLGIDLPRCYLDLQPRPEPLEANRTQGFISLLEEAMYFASAPDAGPRRGAEFRRTHRCVDSGFWDDPGYSRALHHACMRILTRPRASAESSVDDA